MRYLHLNGRHVVFFCDDCGKRLDEADPGEAFWEDYNAFVSAIENAFVSAIEAGEEVEEVRFLCWKCFRRSRGAEQEWFDPRWRQLI
jgi:hypothetical protein